MRSNSRIVVVPLSGTRNVSTFGSGPGNSSNQLNIPKRRVRYRHGGLCRWILSNSRVQKWSRNGTNPMTSPGASSLGYWLFFVR